MLWKDRPIWGKEYGEAGARVLRPRGRGRNKASWAGARQ